MNIVVQYSMSCIHVSYRQCEMDGQMREEQIAAKRRKKGREERRAEGMQHANSLAMHHTCAVVLNHFPSCVSP